MTSILHDACGLISTVLSAVKMFIEQPLILEIQSAAEEQRPERKELYENIEPAKRMKFTESGIIRIPSVGGEDGGVRGLLTRGSRN